MRFFNSRHIICICVIMFGFISSVGVTGCSITSGLQAGDLPPAGTFVADNGIKFNIQPLNMATLPYTSLQNDSANKSINNAQLLELLQTSHATDYLISSSDILSITLAGNYPAIPSSTHTDTNSSSSNPYAAGYPVDQKGYIQFPLIGQIKASGLTISQFTDNLRNQLQRYLKYPDPQVKIVNYRGNKFFVDGEVNEPGEFSITDEPVSLYTALSLAGGATVDGDTNSITLIRAGQKYDLGLRDLQHVGVSANNIYLQDGDTLHVNNQDRNMVYVLGEFNLVKPVLIPEQGLSLANVLGESRGLNSNTANAAKIYVVRDHRNLDFTNIYYVDMQTLTNLPLANRFQMQPNDIVYVDPTGLTQWSRFINSVLPSTNLFSSLSGL